MIKKLIIGLGNPGQKYESTRHNIGWMVLDILAKQLKLKFKKHSRNESEIAEGEGIILAKPLTFMNNSGRAVAKVAKYFGVPAENITVIYDELDLPIGTVRKRPSGSSGGHNGMQSIIDHLKTTNVERIRIGIGRSQADPSEYVLKPFTRVQRAAIKPAIEETIALLTKAL